MVVHLHVSFDIYTFLLFFPLFFSFFTFSICFIFLLPDTSLLGECCCVFIRNWGNAFLVYALNLEFEVKKSQEPSEGRCYLVLNHFSGLDWPGLWALCNGCLVCNMFPFSSLCCMAGSRVDPGGTRPTGSHYNVQGTISDSTCLPNNFVLFGSAYSYSCS